MAVHVKDRTPGRLRIHTIRAANPETVERAVELVHIINCDIEVRVLTHGSAPSSIQATHTSSHREKKDSVLSGRKYGTIRAFVQDSDAPSCLYVDRATDRHRSSPTSPFALSLVRLALFLLFCGFVSASSSGGMASVPAATQPAKGTAYVGGNALVDQPKEVRPPCSAWLSSRGWILSQ
jgi:hypothetical protein